MASQHRPSEGLKSIVGGALVGLGLHILFGNLDRVAEQMKHMLGSAASETLGVLPSAVLAASQAVQTYGLDHQGFWQSLLWIGFWILISFWPLVAVTWKLCTMLLSALEELRPPILSRSTR